VTARPRSARATTVWLVAALLFLGACSSLRDGDSSSIPVMMPTHAGHPSLSSYRSTRMHVATAAPVRVRIPSIDVDSGLQELGLAPDQTIEVPTDPSTAGWWSGGPRPGQVGPAVVVGHVDSKTGPAVFFRLRELAPGEEVLIDRADGTTARFTVTTLDRYQKALFPSDLVYYPTLQPQIRLVTCGGPFDPSTGHYRDNVVVYADQASQ
jgi:Sortase domain